MKKLISLILICVMCLSFASCGGSTQGGDDGNNQGGDNGNTQGNNIPSVSDPLKVESAESQDAVTVVFSRLPENAQDLQNVDFSNEFQVAASIAAVLCYYETDPDKCFEMMNVLKGPEDISEFDKSFIKEQFSQYPYVARSYIIGSNPDNDYSYESVMINIAEGPYSRTEDGYVELWLQSGGADSPRSVKLRKKESTNEWFLFSDTYKGLLAGIRQPAGSDPWK